MGQDIESRLHAVQLTVSAVVHPDDMAGVKTVVLLSPDEPRFWPAFKTSPEFQDGHPHAMDRWSSRVIEALARDLNAQPIFPFGSPPYHPFIKWALASGRIWQSPVQLLVADHAGLFISFRGALAFADHLSFDEPSIQQNPCQTCADTPCVTACPADALTPSGYDVPRCKAFLDTKTGQDCLIRGCQVRRACPVSQNYDRVTEQSAYHMRAFL